MIDGNVKKRPREGSSEEPPAKRYREALEESNQEFISCFQAGIDHVNYVGADKEHALPIIAGYLEKKSLKKVINRVIRDTAKGNIPAIVDYLSKAESNGLLLAREEVVFTIKLAERGPQTPLFLYLRETNQNSNFSQTDSILETFEQRLRNLKL